MKPLLPLRRAGVMAAVLASNILPHPPLLATEVFSELPYQSVFERYQRHTDAEITSWQQSNQVVTERGGWRAYAQETSAHEAPHNAHTGSGSNHDHSASPPTGSTP